MLLPTCMLLLVNQPLSKPGLLGSCLKTNKHRQSVESDIDPNIIHICSQLSILACRSRSYSEIFMGSLCSSIHTCIHHPIMPGHHGIFRAGARLLIETHGKNLRF